MARTTKSDQIEDAVEAPAEDVIVNTEEATEAPAEVLEPTAAEGQPQPSPGDAAIIEAQASPDPEQEPLPEISSLPVSEASTVAAAVEDGEIVLAPGIEVVCLSKGGRRRAGRDWPVGSTIVPADDLTPYQLQQLRGDPRFRVGFGSDTDLPCEGC